MTTTYPHAARPTQMRPLDAIACNGYTIFLQLFCDNSIPL